MRHAASRCNRSAAAAFAHEPPEGVTTITGRGKATTGQDGDDRPRGGDIVVANRRGWEHSLREDRLDPNGPCEAGLRVSTLATDRKRSAQELFAPLGEHYDRVAAILSFGQDPRWRRTIVEEIAAQPGERVLDVATGTGLVAEALAKRWGCEVVGVDQSSEMLEVARRRLEGEEALASRVTLVEGEAERLPFEDGAFDHLTFTYLLRYVEDPQATMCELARVVRPGGRIASLEFGVPGSQPWRALWELYTHVGLPALGRLVSREWSQTGSFLAGSIPDFYARYPLPSVAAMWREAGIDAVSVRTMSLGGGVVMWGSRGGGGPRRAPYEDVDAPWTEPGDAPSSPAAPVAPLTPAGGGDGG